MVIVLSIIYSYNFPSEVVYASLITEMAEREIGADATYTRGIYALMTTLFYQDDRYPVRSTQAEHREGVTTTLTVTSTVETSSEASGSLGCSASAEVGVGLSEVADVTLSGTLAAEVGVAFSVSYSLGTSVSYTLDDDIEPGLYRIAIVFPRRTVNKSLYGINTQGIQSTLWSETVTYAPRENDAYWTVENYELGE